jgi:hypothetical protein
MVLIIRAKIMSDNNNTKTNRLVIEKLIMMTVVNSISNIDNNNASNSNN